MRPIDADALMEYCNNLKDKTIDTNDIARFPTACGWNSVKDRLPDEKPEEYLVVNGGIVETAIYIDGWITPKRVINITHWMPLPEPPEEETK